MKKNMLWFMLVMFLALAVVTAGCGGDKQKNDAGAKKDSVLKTDDGKIVVMYEDHFKPYSYTENSEAKGINIDILQEAFKRAGVEVKFATAPWRRVQQLVEEGSADAFCSPYKTAEREAKYLFSSEYLSKEETVFAVKKDSQIDFSGDLSQLSKYTIGYIRGYSPLTKDEAVLKKLKIEEMDNNAQMLEKLLSGRVDLIANDKLTLMAELKEMNKTDAIKFLDVPIKTDDAYIAYTKKTDMSELAAKIDKAIAEMRNEGLVEKIIDKYTK